jgi:hypothetical protein
MEAFINPLLGVVAGGAVTYATQRGLDGRRERRDREREARADEPAAEDAELTNRAAARLVFLDLPSIFTFLHSSREVSRWWVAMRLPSGAWENHRQQLCRVLSDESFRLVGSTFGGVRLWPVASAPPPGSAIPAF